MTGNNDTIANTHYYIVYKAITCLFFRLIQLGWNLSSALVFLFRSIRNTHIMTVHFNPLSVVRTHDDRSTEHLSDVRQNAWEKFMTTLRWYPKDMSPSEKRLVLKLDLMILVYGCLCFFTKYLSQASLTNAYVT